MKAAHIIVVRATRRCDKSFIHPAPCSKVLMSANDCHAEATTTLTRLSSRRFCEKDSRLKCVNMRRRVYEALSKRTFWDPKLDAA